MSKIEQIELFLGETNPDIFLIAEHGLNEEKIEMINLQNYSLASHYCRNVLHKGGTGIFLNDRIQFDKIKKTNYGKNLNEEQVFESSDILVEIGGRRLIVASMYRSPIEQNLDAYFEKFETYLTKLKTLKNSVLIGADYNINMFQKDRKTEAFSNILKSHGLHTTTEGPTRISELTETCIDNFATNIQQTKSEVVEAFISDHQAICVEIPLPVKINKKKYFQKSRKVNQETLYELKIRLKSEKWREVFEAQDVEVKYNKFMNLFTYYYDIACPIVNTEIRSISKNKWKNDEIVVAKQNMFELYSNWRLGKEQADKKRYIEAKEGYQKIILKSKSEYIANTLKISNNVSKTAWRFINEMRSGSKKPHKNVLLQENGAILKNPNIIAEEFNNYFANIATMVNNDQAGILENTYPGNLFSADLNPGNIPKINTFKEINVDDLFKIISKFQPKTSYGVDQVSMKVLKYCSNEIVMPLLDIINSSIRAGLFPSQCKMAKVRPIFKKGSDLDKGNYRPISLLPSVSKIIERVVSEQLTHYLESNILLSSRQYGFRKGRSTKLALIEFVNECIDAMEAGESVVGCFADLTKAFDCVNTDILLAKLKWYGIAGRALTWFESYLSDRHQITEIPHSSNNSLKFIKSKSTTINSGVPQGSILGPILFLIYINDISNIIPEQNLFQFADDTTLFTRSSNCERLETESFVNVNLLAQYFSQNQLKLNASKTGYLCIQTRQKKDSVLNKLPELFIGDDQLERQETADFLGVRLDDTLSWDEQVKKIEAKLAKGLFALRLVSKFGNCNLNKMVYFSLIESHITYSLVLWGSIKSHLNKVFIWQKKSVRAMLGLHSQAHCRDAFKQLKILTVPSLFIYESIWYARQTEDSRLIEETHHYNTRHKNVFAEFHRLTTYEKKPSYIGRKLLQVLPSQIKLIENPHRFKVALKNFLLEQCFYNIEEYWECTKTIIHPN